MTDREREAKLRLATRGRVEVKGPPIRPTFDAIMVLADFYEEHGQHTRARLWRQAARVEERRIDLRDPPDLMTKRAMPSAPVDPRRNAMMWLLWQLHEHAPQCLTRFTSHRAIGAAIGIGAGMVRHYIARHDNIIRHAAVEERTRPTMRATQRLKEAGALRGEMYLHEIELPPDEFPLTYRLKARPAEDRWKLRNKTNTSPPSPAASADGAASPPRASRGAKDVAP